MTFTADVDHLKSLGADISRHNLASDLAAMPGTTACAAAWRWPDLRGCRYMVDGVTVATGRYPARDQLLRYAGLASVTAPANVTELGLTAVTGGSCGPAGGC